MVPRNATVFRERFARDLVDEMLLGLTLEEQVTLLRESLIRARHQRIGRLALLIGEYPSMTPGVAHLFLCLWDSRNRVTTYGVISERLAEMLDDESNERAINTTMKRLRKDIKRHTIPVLIETVYGMGYMLRPLSREWEPPWGDDEPRYLRLPEGRQSTKS